MLEQYAAHLRFHFQMPKRKWDLEKFSESEIIEMYYEYCFVKEQRGEIKTQNQD